MFPPRIFSVCRPVDVIYRGILNRRLGSNPTPSSSTKAFPRRNVWIVDLSTAFLAFVFVKIIDDGGNAARSSRVVEHLPVSIRFIGR